MTYYKRLGFLGLTMLLVPGMSAAQEWDGFYGGLSLGYTALDTTHNFSNGAPSGSSDPDGALYGGFAGYGVQTGQLVLGIEANIEGSSASGSFSNSTGITSRGRAELNIQGSIRGILGFAGNLGAYPALFYGAVGWAVGDFDFKGGPAGAPFGTGYSDTLDGLTLGLGINTRLGNNFSIRTEYTYTDYGKSSGSIGPALAPPCIAVGGVGMPVSVKQHAFRIGLRKEF
jgi:outer membrane immunogenic protein